MQRLTIIRSISIGLACSLTLHDALGASQATETRIAWRASCPSEPKERMATVIASLVAIVAPKLVDTIVDYASTALTTAASDKSYTSSGSNDTNFYSVSTEGDLTRNQEVGCLVIKHGQYSDEPGGTTDVFSALQTPFVEIELKLVPLPGLKYFQLKPVSFKSHKAEESSWFRDADRDYTIAISMKSPGADSPFASGAISILNVTPGQKGVLKGYQLLRYVGEPMPFPASMADANAAQAKQQKIAAPYAEAMAVLEAANENNQSASRATKRPPDYNKESVITAQRHLCDEIESENLDLPKANRAFDERCLADIGLRQQDLSEALAAAFIDPESTHWATQTCPKYVAGQAPGIESACGNDNYLNSAAGKTFGPFRTTIALTETAHGAEWAKLFAQAISSSKDDLKAYAKSRLPSARHAAALAEDEASRNATRALVLADLDVEKAEAVLAEALATSPQRQSDVVQARIGLINAKIKSNDAYRNAGLSIPYPELK